PAGFRYVRPVLPLGAHRRAMNPGTDLTLPGQVRIVADLLGALDLEDATLVHADWGGALFLTARGLDHRVARQVILPCEAFGNFRPGLPGRMGALGVRLPGGAQLAARQLRVGWLRRLPVLYGQMARRPVPGELVRRWTEPVLTDPGIRRDLLAYCRGRFDKEVLIADTEALRRFQGDVLVLWSPGNPGLPPAHGRRLAALMPRRGTRRSRAHTYCPCSTNPRQWRARWASSSRPPSPLAAGPGAARLMGVRRARTGRLG